MIEVKRYRKPDGFTTRYWATRFQSVRFQPPENEGLAQFLARRWGAPITITRQIAEGPKGNVRAALADWEMWMGSRPLKKPVARPEGGKKGGGIPHVPVDIG